MTKALLVVGTLGSAAAGFFFSGLIVVLLMEKLGYDWALALMIGYVRKLDIGRFRFNEETGRQAVAVNIQMRVVFTLVWYALIALVLLAISIASGSVLVAIMLFAANAGLLINCLFAIIGEYSIWPMLMRYEGLDESRQLCFKTIVCGKDECDGGNEMFFGLEEAEGLYDIARRGDIVVVFVPPTGDMIYDVVL